MNIAKFSKLNRERSESPEGFNHKLSSWSAAEWTNAVAGEAGEACNNAKKLIRFRDAVAGNTKFKDRVPDVLRRAIAMELADTIIYCDLAIQAMGFDMETVLTEVFNAKSEQIGFTERL